MKTHRTNYLTRALVAATTVVVAACGGGSSDTGGGMPPQTANSAPVMSSISDRTVNQDTQVGPIELGIADRETAADALRLSIAADSGDVFPADGLVLGGSGAKRTLTLTPLESATGSAAITLTLTDADGASTARTFRVTVNPRVASIRDTALATFAKAEGDAPTAINGYTFDQDADDAATFQPLIGAE
jgi:hypothetical protein